MDRAGNLDYWAKNFVLVWANYKGGPNIYIISKDSEARKKISDGMRDILSSEKRDARVFELDEAPHAQLNGSYIVHLDDVINNSEIEGQLIL